MLERPGAGISAFETFTMTTLGKRLMALLPWSFGVRVFNDEGARMLAAVAGRSAAALTTRVLVPRQLAMEDSSRYWSAAMVARHLIVVGDKVARIMVSLGKGTPSAEPVVIADVKPDPATSASVFGEYRAFLTRFNQVLREDVVDRRSPATHAHPWSGPMTVHQWLQLAAMHQRIHRVQLERILRAL
jgi:uncharacterized damage-inducible protein DinB